VEFGLKLHSTRLNLKVKEFRAIKLFKSTIINKLTVDCSSLPSADKFYRKMKPIHQSAVEAKRAIAASAVGVSLRWICRRTGARLVVVHPLYFVLCKNAFEFRKKESYCCQRVVMSDVVHNQFI